MLQDKSEAQVAAALEQAKESLSRVGAKLEMLRADVKKIVAVRPTLRAIIAEARERLLDKAELALHAAVGKKEKAAFESLNSLYKKGGGYAAMMVTRPQTVGYGLADSPAGQAAWIYDKFAAWTYSGGEPEKALTRDEMLDDIKL